MKKRTINTKSVHGYMSHIPADELVEAGKELSSKGFQLLMYYYSKGNSWNWNEEKMILELEWNKRQISDYHKELTKKRYLLKFNGAIVNVFIGKKAVSDFYQEDTNA